MPGAVGQASSPAGSGGFQPRVGVRSARHARSLGQDAPKTGRLEAFPTKYLITSNLQRLAWAVKKPKKS
jgi:hypothetical protein